jgi:hypothetical protein
VEALESLAEVVQPETTLKMDHLAQLAIKVKQDL